MPPHPPHPPSFSLPPEIPPGKARAAMAVAGDLCGGGIWLQRRRRVARRRGAAVPDGERESTMTTLARPPRIRGALVGAAMSSASARAQMGLGGPTFLASAAGAQWWRLSMAVA
jgi:hypothetical protein